jgi:prophage antirepressor-like protein/5-methylcytosine-specific restriction endonuclease McrA
MTKTKELVPYQSVKFQETAIEIYDHEGNRWVTLNQFATALGYGDRRALQKLLDRHTVEFTGKTTVVNLTTLEGGVEKEREVTIINYHGIIRASMLAKTRRAKEFRDWAEEVLFEVMTTGHIDLTEESKDKSPLDFTREALHQDLAMLRNFVTEDPTTAEWVYPRVQALWDNYASNYVEPKIATTQFSEDWLKRLYIGEGWSKDTIRSYFPIELTSNSVFDNYRKMWGLPLKKASKITNSDAMQIFRDYHQLGIRMDTILRKYHFYSQDSIQKQLKKIEANIINVLSSNHIYGVKRFDKQSYSDYRSSKEWGLKRNITLAPSGPFDNCWDCRRPISLSTAHLHHMTYERVGFELWTDFRPLCSVCHHHRHISETTTVTPQLITNFDGKVVTLTDTQIVGETEKAIRCIVNGKSHWFPKKSIAEQSQIKGLGDTGDLLVEPWIAKRNGLL